MKKLLVVLVVALLALALVACGGETETSTEPATSTTPAGTSDTSSVADTSDDATPDDSSSVADSSDVTPDDSSSDVEPEDTDPETEDTDYVVGDLIWDPDCMALNAIGYDYCMFEDTHASLDNHVALVMSFSDYGGVYSDLFLINPDNADNNTNWEPNLEYTWVATIDGVEYTINRFSLFNNGTSGWVRCDLGADFSWNNYEYVDGVYGYDIKLHIYDSNRTAVYSAYLTDPEVNGLYYHTKPGEVAIIVDPNRPDNYVRVDQSLADPLSGPDSGISEGYKQFFDGNIRTKICTGDNGETGTVVVKYTTPLNVIGFSLVNANDNSVSTGRTIVAFELYGSNDGENWTLITAQDGMNEDGSAIDKTAISADYQERFYGLENTVTYQYFKFVPNNGEMWQCSELYFYQEG